MSSSVSLHLQNYLVIYLTRFGKKIDFSTLCTYLSIFSYVYLNLRYILFIIDLIFIFYIEKYNKNIILSLN